MLRATTACTFSTSELPKVVRDRQFLTLLTWKWASRHNGVHFFDISSTKSGPHLVCFVHLETASNHQLCLLGRGEPKDHIFLSSQSGGFQEGTSVENCARRLNMAELSSFLSTASQCGIFVFLRLLRKTVAQENAMGLSGDSRDSPQMPRHHEPKDRGSAPAPSSH